MPRVVEGNLSGAGLRVALVASRFNSFVVDRLIEGAVDGLRRVGVDDDAIVVHKSPGSFELPAVARRVADSGAYDAVVCLGAVIRGATPHFEYVTAEATKGIAQLAMSASVPVTFGVLTTDSVEQAIDRAGTKSGNKGFDAALAAVELASLYRQLGAGEGKPRPGASRAPGRGAKRP